MSDVTLGDNPNNDELTRAIAAMGAGGSVGAELESDGGAWACTIARYLNELGPDPTDEFGVMRFERVATVATA